MNTLQDRVDGLLSKVNQLGICASEAADVKKAVDDYVHAAKSFNTAVKSAVGGSVGTAVSVVGSVTCLLETEALPVAVTCWAVLIGGFGAGGLSVQGLIETAELASDDVDKAEDVLADALDKLCACISSHVQPQS